MLRLVIWSVSLCVIATVVNCALAAVMLTVLPRGLLFGKSAVQLTPWAFIIVWATGVLVSWGRVRSLEFSGRLAAVGLVLLCIGPFLLFLAFLLFGGGWNVR